ncbi:MAG: RNA ligase family protein [Alphaproteobacteria bacterium]
MKEYHKIETLFERDMAGTKKLIEGNFRSPAVEYLKDCRWSFTEKIDGTNIRVMWDGHKVTFGGRTDNAQIPAQLIAVLTEMFLGDANEQIFESMFGEKPVTLFGEGYGGKIQGGSLYRQDCSFAMFDAAVNGTFLYRDDISGIAKPFGAASAPLVFSGTIAQAVSYVKSRPLSKIAQNNLPMEGIVGVPDARLFDHWGARIIVKIKAKDFES